MGFVAALALALGLGCRLLARLPGHDACELGETVVGGMVEPGARDVVVPVRKKAWEAAFGGEEAARPHVRARLTGWPSRALVDRATLPPTDREFVARLARDTWRGLEAFTDREDHLPVDNVRFAGTSVDGAGARVGDYTNVTSVGLRLIALVAAADLDLVPRTEAIRRVRRLLATLEGLETYRGFFYNYYDTTSRERTSNFLSFVDSSWLTAGLMVVRTAFPELGESCSRIIAAQDYRFFYDATRQRMTHGYYVHLAAPSRFHYGTLYAESRLGSLIAIGTGAVPEAHWFAMARTYAAGCGWQTQTPHGRTPKDVRGHRVVGANDAAHVAVQRRFATEELGYPVWGISPSMTPARDAYGEYGVRVLGVLGYGAGAVTPHAAALALGVAPDAAAGDLKELASRYDVYGDFGLYDAVDPRSGAVARAYLALDQTMTFIAAANYLKDHCIQRRFAADPIAARALPLLAAERFFD